MDTEGIEPRLYAGLSGVTLNVESYDLGCCVRLRPIYAHLMAPCITAFHRAPPGKAHPAPWKAASGGGTSFDAEVELSVPTDQPLPSSLSPEDAITWLAILMRLLEHPYMLVPLLSDRPLDVAQAQSQEGSIWPYETKHRIVAPTKERNAAITIGQLDWLKKKWVSAAPLYAGDEKFRLALHAVDACMVEGKPGAALLGVWGALEQLFLPGGTELRYRIASNIAAYMEEPGEQRLRRFKEILSLYDSRSRAAHSSKGSGTDVLMRSFILARNALIQMIGAGSVPTQEELERMLFCNASLVATP